MECELPTSRLTPVALEPLPHPVYFVYPSRSRWEELLRRVSHPTRTRGPTGSGTATHCWVMLTYLHLRRRGLDVRLVERPVCEAINVITIHDLAIRSWAYDAFTVVCRNDSFRPMICADTIVQNPYNAHTTTDHLVQHWPQPGLLPREASRGTRVENIVYKGDELNLWEGFRSPEFVESLRYWLGVSFRCDGKPEDKAALRWHDYQDADVVLAVRDLTEADYRVSRPAN